MYVPPIFKEEDHKKIVEFVRTYSFATLVSNGEQGIQATHIPIEIIERDGLHFLQGHVSKGNQQHHDFGSENEVLAIFKGADAYISPTWYNHENVPTWNYSAVHIYGKTRVIKGEELMESLEFLIDKYEGINGSEFKLSDLSEKTLKRELRGIVGFEMSVDRVQAAFKLSQNRDQESFDNVVHHLAQKEEHGTEKQVSADMISRCPYHKS